MILPMGEQGFIFLLICFTGFCFGCFYDAFRILRRLIPHFKAAVFAEDIAFWFISAVFMLYMLMGINYADVRIYMTVGFIGGMFVYFNTLSPYVICFGTRLLGFLFKPVILFIFLLKKRAKCGIIIITKAFNRTKEMLKWRLLKRKK